MHPPISGLKRARITKGLEVLGTNDRSSRGKISFGVFKGSALQRVVLPSTLKVVQFCTFSKCKALKQVSLPDGLERIEEMAFAETGLSKAVLPKDISYVSSDAFDCPTTKGE